MIDIDSRGKALEVFGPIGLTAWDWFTESGLDKYHSAAFGAQFIQPKKLEPLGDNDLVEIYDGAIDDGAAHYRALRLVVEAYDERMASILEQGA